MMGFGGVLGILLIAVIIWAVIQYAENNKSTNSNTINQQKSGSNNENALDILKKRYAKGEISQDEFEQMKKKIS